MPYYCRNIAIIFIKSRDEGADDTMAKPYDNEELFAPITHLTNRYNGDTKTMKGSE
jgi:DNA-binding response OmpR family regulator